ncbi:hypothetical protein R1sor_012778 [Riccia sorocarpa]|uniref:Uncharacterized protein n=1 Tax=Riccia sorocarpa TaxID=122646 RepID=A0ABD3I4Q3_9MARC
MTVMERKGENLRAEVTRSSEQQKRKNSALKFPALPVAWPWLTIKKSQPRKEEEKKWLPSANVRGEEVHTRGRTGIHAALTSESLCTLVEKKKEIERDREKGRGTVRSSPWGHYRVEQISSLDGTSFGRQWRGDADKHEDHSQPRWTTGEKRSREEEAEGPLSL